MVKCLVCGEMFDRDEEPYYIVGRRYVHGKGVCEQQAREQEEEKKKSVNDKKKEEQYRKELIEYVMHLQGTERPHGMALKQMKEYREMGYTYQGMKSTLYYFHEILEKEVVGTGIGIVPFVYEDAIDYFTNKVEVNKAFNKLLEEGKVPVTSSQTTIKVSEKKANERNNRRKRINMEELE